MPKVKITASISFFVYLVFLVCLRKGLGFFNYLVVLFIHEYSHAVVAYKLGYKLTNIKLAPFGICLNIDSNKLEKQDSIKIALAGPITNIVFAIVISSMWWIFPESYFFTSYLFEANVVTAVFNLLPCYPLDGGRVLNELLPANFNKKTIFWITNSLFFVLFACGAVVFNNISLLVVGVFVFVSCFSFSKAPSYDCLLYEKIHSQPICKTKTYVVNSDLKLFKLMPYLSQSSFAIFLVRGEHGVACRIYESELEEIFSKYSPQTKLQDVVSKLRPLSKI